MTTLAVVPLHELAVEVPPAGVDRSDLGAGSGGPRGEAVGVALGLVGQREGRGLRVETAGELLQGLGTLVEERAGDSKAGDWALRLGKLVHQGRAQIMKQAR